MAEKTITFKTHQEEIQIPLRFFLYQSKAFQPSKTQESSGGTIDLSEYDVKVVKAFIMRIQEPLKSYKYDISIIKELYELAQIFQLQRLSEEIENQICPTEDNQTLNEFGQYLFLLNDKGFCDSKLGKELLKKTISKFDSLSTTSYLLSLNGSILSTILDSCELPVSSEVKVFEFILMFLKTSDERLLHAYSLFSCIRISRLNDAQRKQMMKALEEVPQAPQVILLAGYIFNEENSYRCCILKGHEKYSRCGKIPAELHGTENTIFSNKIKLYNDLLKPEHQKESYRTATGSMITTVQKGATRSLRHERRKMREMRAKAAFEKSNRRYFSDSKFG